MLSFTIPSLKSPTIGKYHATRNFVTNLPPFGRSTLSLRGRRSGSALGFAAGFATLLNETSSGCSRDKFRGMSALTLAALSIATSARPRKTSQGATRPEAGNSPLSSSSISDESALVTSDEGGNVRFEPGGADTW